MGRPQRKERDTSIEVGDADQAQETWRSMFEVGEGNELDVASQTCMAGSVMRV